MFTTKGNCMVHLPLKTFVSARNPIDSCSMLKSLIIPRALLCHRCRFWDSLCLNCPCLLLQQPHPMYGKYQRTQSSLVIQLVTRIKHVDDQSINASLSSQYNFEVLCHFEIPNKGLPPSTLFPHFLFDLCHDVVSRKNLRTSL